LNNHDMTPEAEEQWLELSTHAATLLIACNELEEVSEVDMFRAVSRWTDHQHAKLTAEEQATTSKQQLAAPLIAGIKFKLMTACELDEEVKPSGVLSDAQLAACFRSAALHTTFVIADPDDELGEDKSNVVLHGTTSRDRTIRWAITIRRVEAKLEFSFTATRRTTKGFYPTVSLAGIKVHVYRGRSHAISHSFGTEHRTLVPCNWTLFELDRSPPMRGDTALTVRVRVPKQALVPVATE
jgi:hypothetical protein